MRGFVIYWKVCTYIKIKAPLLLCGAELTVPKEFLQKREEYPVVRVNDGQTTEYVFHETFRGC